MGQNNSADRIGARIKAAREAMGYSAQKTADLAGEGFSKSSILNYECGIRTPSVDKLHILATVLQTDSAYLALFSDHTGKPSEGWRYVHAEDESGKVDSSAFLSFNIDALNAMGISERDIVLANVNDDALAPDLKTGDSVLINKRAQKMINDTVVAIQAPDKTVHFRRVRQGLGGEITLYSDDPERYPAETYNPDTMHLLGRMVGSWRRSHK